MSHYCRVSVTFIHCQSVSDTESVFIFAKPEKNAQATQHEGRNALCGPEHKRGRTSKMSPHTTEMDTAGVWNMRILSGECDTCKTNSVEFDVSN